MNYNSIRPSADFVIKKRDGHYEKWQPEKIASAIQKSASRYMVSLSDEQITRVIRYVSDEIEASGESEVSILDIHSYVEMGLDEVNRKVAKSYREFRNFKQTEGRLFKDVWNADMQTRYLGDFENANKDSTLVATKQSLLRSAIDKAFYFHYDVRKSWLQAHQDGYIYIHDASDRRDSFNCCLFRVGKVMKGGYNHAGIAIQEAKNLSVAASQIKDIAQSAAPQQYGGFTIPQVDKILSPYAEKSYQLYCKDFLSVLAKNKDELSEDELIRMDKFAEQKVEKEIRQAIQSWEIQFNTIGSSRGDYPFITISLGLDTSRWGKLITKTAFKVHQEGQGAKGKGKPVLFPKYVFLYDDEIHGVNGISEDVFDAAIECSQKTMYPDYLSLSGKGYISDMYKAYKTPISPMGCRAFLSPWYERGGMNPADEWDTPIFEGRFNIGVVSLNLPMIYLKAQKESKSFFEVLDYYLELIREIHLYTYEYLGQLKASCDPLAFCEGGFYNPLGDQGLNPDEKIEPFLRCATASFGVTALNELQEAYNGKSLVEDGEFSLKVMEYINKKVNDFKNEDGRLYAIYGTPAESLTGKQANAIKALYGSQPWLKEYVSNSFHCGVWEDITPIQKQDLEGRFWELFNGGKIQYCHYSNQYNTAATKTLIRRAMKLGYYEGVNMSLSFCEDCGYSSNDIGESCPHCGGKHLTTVDRMNGYLAYSRVSVKQNDGSVRVYSRLNRAKNIEISDRVSM